MKMTTLPSLNPSILPVPVLSPGLRPETFEQPEPILHFSNYWMVFRRWKWLLIASGILGLALGYLFTLLRPSIYEARASLEVQNLNDNFLNMKQVLPVSDAEEPANSYGDIQTQIKVLQSNSVLTPVLMRLPEMEAHLQVSPSSPWSRIRGRNVDPQQHFQAEGERLANTLKVREVGQTRIVEVTAESTNPRIAADFVNQLCHEYIDQNMNSRWEMSQRTSQSLGHLLEDAQQNLRRSELALQAYAQNSGLLFTSDKKSVAEEKLSELQNALSAAQANRIEAQSRYEIAKKHLEDPEANGDFDTQSRDALQEYQGKLADLRRQRAELATIYTPNYSKVRRIDAQINSLSGTIAVEARHLVKRAESQFREASRREGLLSASYQQQSATVADLGKRAVQYNILQRELEGNRRLYDEMLRQVKEATLAAAIPSSNVRILDTATAPQKRKSPKLFLNCALGFIGFMSLGTVLAFVREHNDHTVREPGDALLYMGVPELGFVPQDKHGTGLIVPQPDGQQLEIVTALSSGSPNGNKQMNRCSAIKALQSSDSLSILESCRAVATSLLLSETDGNVPNVVVVTSPGQGEGKSTVVANLGLILASIGKRVLLVDADLRCSRLHAIFGLERKEGLLDNTRVSERNISDCIQETRVHGLSIANAGTRSSTDTTLLYSGEFPRLLRQLIKEFDFVLLDTPPLLHVADARVMGRSADGVVLVIRAGHTSREAAVAAHRRLEADGTRVLGVVLNDWNPKGSYSAYRPYRAETLA